MQYIEQKKYQFPLIINNPSYSDRTAGIETNVSEVLKCQEVENVSK